MKYLIEYKNKSKEYFFFERAEMLQFLPKEADRILDVGCGAGSFGLLIKKSFPKKEVWGIEPDLASFQIASTRLDNTINSLFNNEVLEKIGKQKFDLIFFNDVLEHMLDPQDALLLCKKILNQGGFIVASIPNFLFIENLHELIVKKDWEYKDAGILDKTHLRFFTRKSMIRLFSENGYEVLQVEGINTIKNRYLRMINFFSIKQYTEFAFQQFVLVSKIK